MKCANCGELGCFTIYKGNSLCLYCFELARLLENKYVALGNPELYKEWNKRYTECEYWIKVNREAYNFHYPRVVK